MTLKSQIADEATTVFLDTDEFAETAMHYPAGVEDDETDPAPTGLFVEHKPTRDESRGREVVRTATLQVDDALAVTVDDTWVIRGERWQTTAVKAASAGLITVHLQRNDIEEQGRAGGGLK